MIAVATRPDISRATSLLTNGHQNGHCRDAVPLMVGLNDTVASQPAAVGSRAARLALATRSCLPIPAGSVLTPAALGCIEQAARSNTSDPADAIGDAFDRLGLRGRVPLMISVSAVAEPGSSADKIVASRAVTTRSELLHIIRRLSATSNLLGDTIAIVIQRDVETMLSGTMRCARTDARTAASINASRDDWNSTRLLNLGRRVRTVFGYDCDVTWTFDQHDRLWLLDIGAAVPAS